MKKIILNRIIIYSLLLIFCIFIANLDNNASTIALNKFTTNLNKIVTKYGYIETKNYLFDKDYKFTQSGNENNFIILSTISTNTIKIGQVNIKKFYTNFNYKYGDDMSNSFNLYEEILNKTKVSDYKSKIEDLISKFKSTKENQKFEELNNERQLIITIEKSKDIEKDFIFRYSVTEFN